MNTPQSFDAGLQPERVLLAWRRTCLVLALGIGISIRLGVINNPPLAMLLGLPALTLVSVAYATTALRYRRATRLLAEDQNAAVADGRPIAAVSGVSFLIGVAVVVFVMAHSDAIGGRF